MFHVKQKSDKLRAYSDLLLRWNRHINLIGKSTEDEVWQRHILDSAQLVEYIKDENCQIADLGAGAGLPGIVLSILGSENVTLIEADTKKCVFLRQVRRDLGLQFNIIEDRIENIKDKKFDLVTSRAMASVRKLIELSTSLRGPESEMLLLKGANSEEEIKDARQVYSFDVQSFKSQSFKDGVVLKIKNIG